jgi:hypothetical protein
VLVSLPYSFSPGTLIYSAQVNANFTAVANAVNSIDNTNIGASGIYASNIIPASTAQATFGGSQSYTFTKALTVNGGYVSPVLTFAGSPIASTQKMCVGTVYVPILTGNASNTLTVTLTGSAVFTSSTSYIGLATLQNFPSVGVSSFTAFVQPISGSQCYVTVQSPTTAGSNGTAIVYVALIGT